MTIPYSAFPVQMRSNDYRAQRHQIAGALYASQSEGFTKNTELSRD